jgi:lipoprotein Spr
MKLQGPTIGFFVLLVFTGCSSIRRLSAKDSAASSSSSTKKNNSSGKREFLNGIEVTPGGMITAKAATGKKAMETRQSESYGNAATKAASFGIEHASMLQLKYAIATDATVEKMTNIPLLETIDKWWGTKYCMGGFTNDCIDCSAFTQVIYKDVFQVLLPRTSQEQYNACEKIELEDLREGDLVFFNTGGTDVSHVGVYLLNNKFVHAATSGGVMISDLNDKYWQPKFRGAGRMTRQDDMKGSK